MTTDSKWQFCLKLKRFYRTCFISNSRVSAHYERDWNDAVTSLMASIGPLYKGQDPFLGTLLEDTQRLIPCDEVAAALEALEVGVLEEIREGRPIDYIAEDVAAHINATITKLGLAPGKDGLNGLSEAKMR